MWFLMFSHAPTFPFAQFFFLFNNLKMVSLYRGSARGIFLIAKIKRKETHCENLNGEDKQKKEKKKKNVLMNNSRERKYSHQKKKRFFFFFQARYMTLTHRGENKKKEGEKKKRT